MFIDVHAHLYDEKYESIEKVIKKSVQNNMFNSCDVFDVYKGEHVREGAKSIACRIKLQDKNATLTDEKIDEQMKLIRSGLEKSIKEITFRE